MLGVTKKDLKRQTRKQFDCTNACQKHKHSTTAWNECLLSCTLGVGAGTPIMLSTFKPRGATATRPVTAQMLGQALPGGGMPEIIVGDVEFSAEELQTPGGRRFCDPDTIIDRDNEFCLGFDAQGGCDLEDCLQKKRRKSLGLFVVAGLAGLTLLRAGR